PHKALALMTPVEYILKENKNCNMWWTHTSSCTTFITCYHKYATLLLASYIFVLLFVPELTS
ncbi:hypothetical protein, partial [Escherichia albertii]|uniref:hypothetical protein n=1 Tax=Escherichia albertii TaxID=208962 RepID=UPI00201860DD